jgi:iron uptake system component EfeO
VRERSTAPIGWLPRVLVSTAVMAVLGAAIAGAASTPGTSTASPDAVGLPETTLTVNDYSCAPTWPAPRAGEQSLQVANQGTANQDVDVVGEPSGKVFGEIDQLGPGTTSDMVVDLPPGRYALRCAPEDFTVNTGPSYTLAGPGDGNAETGVLPVTTNDLYPVVKAYQAYVQAGLGTLLPLTRRLNADVGAGDLGAARADWLAAHLAYTRLGGAYDAFGALGDAIDGLPDGLARGVNDPHFTGFRRIEYGLWHDQSAGRLAPYTAKLVADVDTLAKQWPSTQVDPTEMGLRAHEILEDGLRDELTGATDQGSGSNLATLSADVDGTREMLSVLRPILASRYPRLGEATSWLNRFAAAVAAQHDARTGAWTPVDQLTRAASDQLDSTLGQTVELLAPIAVICDPRITQ